ncbi:MAG: sulfate adenylyltransferase subunit CysN [Phreatobacter sp.]|uniref:sulfate adenylyltransferase subunit CysN n=1 Tax=Phreatobacter sp. TaxID=1966341 RepID=UPI002733DC4C|nr:sulfate adenylyltransferase subunit CysN [Phreatobacter sp.]MDP2804064.1 sulfate adenylyltransferase subunit CysN [Phreatobacter sp.]
MTTSETLAPSSELTKSLLRFITCGSVDDGKSTLIGRLLYDAKMIFDDQLSTLERDSRKHGTVGDEIDLALLVDGLEAEREQGITIDVAYRFFTTDRRSFIVADTPGHEQYTRNMATGASTADAAIILVDARKGILTQTKRHTYICSLLGIQNIVLAINKMDLVDFAGERFFKIVSEYIGFAQSLGFGNIRPVPISARFGDNVANKSQRMSWYDGPSILAHLEKIPIADREGTGPFRFPVQWVNRPNLDFRGLAGTVASGRIEVGEEVQVVSSSKRSRVSRIVTFDGDLTVAEAGQAVTLMLEKDVDVTRGDLLCRPDATPDIADQFQGHLLWMGDDPMLQGRSYFLRLGTATVPVRVTTLKTKIDINTLEARPGRTLALNEIGVCTFAAAHPLPIESYADHRRTGSFILIDRATNATVGAGMVQYALRRATNIQRQLHTIDKGARARLSGQKPVILWFTGLSGSGKSTIADMVESGLHRRGVQTMLLDGDNMRHGLNSDLGFTTADRVENIRRVGEVAKLFVDAGLVLLCCFISPFAQDRASIRELVGVDEFIEIFVDVPIEECRKRDPKGLYKKADAGEITNFTGIDSAYEPPIDPEIRVDGMRETAKAASDRIISWLMSRGGGVDDGGI